MYVCMYVINVCMYVCMYVYFLAKAHPKTGKCGIKLPARSGNRVLGLRAPSHHISYNLNPQYPP